MGGTLVVYLMLELWRPCYFLTDDNLASLLSIFTEIGRHLKAGESPFITDYLYGGHYDISRDVSCIYWHPFYLLPALLADTPARFWIIDISALLFLLLAAAGFTLLARALREEFFVDLPDGYLIFYALSFVFSTYVLFVGASNLNFLGNFSALPWLAWGVIQRKLFRAVLAVAVFTLHELLSGYPPLALTGGLCLTIFACGMAWSRHSVRPLISWVVGNILALLVLSPLLLKILDGFAHSARHGDFPIWALNMYSVPARDFAFSCLLGNWSEVISRLQGYAYRPGMDFPFLSSLLCSAAAWCVLPAIFVPARWRALDIFCAAAAAFAGLLIIRPFWLAVVLYHLPVFHSLRWPFREGMLFLFFLHVFLVLRFPAGIRRLQPSVTLFSLLVFVAPLPFIHAPTFDLFSLDRQLLFSGKADKFWAEMKGRELKPGDCVFTVIGWDYYDHHADEIPFTLLGTYNYLSFFQVCSVAGYSTTAPTDQLPLKTPSDFWFGAFREESIPKVFQERPNLKLMRLVSVDPLKITLSDSSGTVIDLMPLLKDAGIDTTSTPRP